MEAGWRLKLILRSRAYFTTPELMRFYKEHILSCTESDVARYFHACDSTLACVDRLQGRFLRAVGLTEEEALLNFRLAPLGTRRCIAIRGFLHRVVLGLTPTQIGELFPLPTTTAAGDNISAQVRGVAQKHRKQFVVRINARPAHEFQDCSSSFRFSC